MDQVLITVELHSFVKENFVNINLIHLERKSNSKAFEKIEKSNNRSLRNSTVTH